MRFRGLLLVGSLLLSGLIVGCGSKKQADDGSGPRNVPPNMKTKEGRPTPNMPPAPPPPPKELPPK
jgi:hypothetical protein